MFYMYEEFARQRAHEARVAAARQRVVSRIATARRWQRAAAWTAHRSAVADRVSGEARITAFATR